MELHYKIIGSILISLASVHVIFPRYFQWKKELSSLSLINRQMFYVHTFFIVLTVFLMGLLCVTSSSELIHTELGRKISFGLFIFWGIRALIQFFGYSSELWKGKKLETTVHIVFSFLWIYFSVIFFLSCFAIGI
ncbi:hypothetical protein EHQ52_10770 [Leptospira koniambonensis]|uniref:Uncharacterized protein n=1 Tax=Leptospira koniambonensis TaxID=2484950 RepID=A0A4R9J8K6_9LEPT|nr:hypothetical protein [Leptospira koniambonensis]TGL34960.1 hypothetical protein EHQ52_10770 [Leptospira koniambonensis]